jgi:beta-glucanase (GH16 family)
MKSITKAIIGTLATSYIAKAKQYYSGEIRTQKPFKYGKFKTRIQGSDQKGTVASLFTFWNGDDD